MSLSNIYGCDYCNECSYSTAVYGCNEGTCHKAKAARDAEHRAELAAAQRTIEQLGKDAATLASDNERLKGELAEARGFVRRVASVCGQVRQPSPQEFEALRIVARWDAPPPAESTPVHEYVSSRTGACMECGKAIGERPPHPPQPAPPDDIRERLERLERDHSIERQAHRIDDIDRRISALEAKGEPGTHAFVDVGVDGCCAHFETNEAGFKVFCGWQRGASIHGDSGCGDHAFVEPKGAKP